MKPPLPPSGRPVKNRYRQLDQKKIPVKQSVKKNKEKFGPSPAKGLFPRNIVISDINAGTCKTQAETTAGFSLIS
ncbi:hypothetical protein [Komagataeibacter sp. FNDCF1]|uniref:hypothetical protein n=1 Tax=Komagataeibacter sp. FNDCF1 TaxID=2878681 RepID=UPI001E55E980|nr:hypothetical protein [Komagataeibacter sp. FNDCF1]MCE2565551.1 hypothetical protein [Komagataeibacter sp. FNDCF1]